jgi:heme exporter protein A
MSEPLLQAVNLRCERGDRVLFQDLSFDILPGTLTRVEGPNGSGKTTLLRVLAGLNDNAEGQVLWGGKDRNANRESFLRNMLYIGHRPGIRPMLSPLENLQTLTAGRAECSTAMLRQALSGTGLESCGDVPCHRLSAGQQRRVALARLLVADEPLWILDEIFTAIDARGVEALERLLSRRVDEGGSIVVTTHHNLNASGMQSIPLGEGGHEL